MNSLINSNHFNTRPASLKITLLAVLILSFVTLSGCATNGSNKNGEPVDAQDYPTLAETQAEQKPTYTTQAIVEYVIECMNRQGGQNLTTLYQCSCQFDQFSQLMDYDEYSQAVVFRNLKSMPGENGGVFRDPPQSRVLRTKLFESEKTAKQKCGIKEKIAKQ